MSNQIKEKNMKRSIAIAATVSAIWLGAINASQSQQVVGSTQLGVAVAELRDVAVGWSARRQILGQSIYNDKGEAIGKADDIIIAPDKAVSYAIIGAGGFLGVGKHDVAIPVSQLKENAGKIVLAGATKEAVKAMPAFEYAR
jgi:sporulation protein YlmC with PRC-barrel domain